MVFSLIKSLIIVLALLNLVGISVAVGLNKSRLAFFLILIEIALVIIAGYVE
ncbi:hypothetical protein HY498_01840 [Candidatus Woesearchaeota archaeon]|nr:hypothetical protein [Candidatus Woesearchaeota archaeon]